MEKKFSISEKGLRFGFKIAETTILGVLDRLFFRVIKVDCSFFRGEIYWGLLILQSFHIYFGITVKSRKNRIFHRFFDFQP